MAYCFVTNHHLSVSTPEDSGPSVAIATPVSDWRLQKRKHEQQFSFFTRPEQFHFVLASCISFRFVLRQSNHSVMLIFLSWLTSQYLGSFFPHRFNCFELDTNILNAFHSFLSSTLFLFLSKTTKFHVAAFSSRDACQAFAPSLLNNKTITQDFCTSSRNRSLNFYQFFSMWEMKKKSSS